MATKKKRAKARTGGRKPGKKTTARRAPKAAKKHAAKPKARAAIASAGKASGKAIPYLCVKGGTAALDFYERAFGAVEKMRIVGKDGSLGHADIEIEGAPLMISDEYPEGGVFSPQTLGGTPVGIHLYVANVDAFAKRALAAGATLHEEVSDKPYGDRGGTLRDPFGHRWMISTKREEVSKEEMERRFGGAYLVS